MRSAVPMEGAADASIVQPVDIIESSQSGSQKEGSPAGSKLSGSDQGMSRGSGDKKKKRKKRKTDGPYDPMLPRKSGSKNEKTLKYVGSDKK